MSTTETARAPEHPHAREPIGTFPTMDGATRAVSHLVELDHEPADVAIAPRDFAEIDRPRLRDRMVPSAGRSATRAGAAVGLVAAAITLGFGATVRVVGLAIVAALVGVAWGAVGAIRAHRRDARGRLPGQRPELRPTAFEVVVDHDASTANHDLATWWDPAAPPLQRTA